jgi:spore maturation protein CgeB
MATVRAPVRILLLGKRGSVVLWLENLARACVRLDHAAHVFAINGDTLVSRLRVKWQGRVSANAGWMLARFERALADFRPDLVVVAGVFGVPLEYYQILHGLSRRPAIAGLVGDRFSADGREQANRCDRLYYTDTRFIRDAGEAGFTPAGRYLPLAVDPELFRQGSGPRRAEVLFVASRTEFREVVVRGLDAPARIIGTDWSALAREGFHRVQNRKIDRRRLIRLYQRHLAVLNVRNEANVEHGLNQRSFEPLACGAVVLNDDLIDLPCCFEPGQEILAYRDADELNALVARLRREPAFATQVVAAGRRRILAEHTYEHRVGTILSDLGLLA